MAKKDPSSTSHANLGGLDPLGLLDGVLGGQGADWEPPMAKDLDTLFPGYDEFEYIDRGGMGAVYSATQKSLERRVAIKILPPEMSRDAAFLERFHQEARMLARLQHPHIVAIHDFGRNRSGDLYIVMEFVEGTSLHEIMKKERLSLGKVLEVAAQVCEALQFAHDRGVVHRDIKPTNILIDRWGRVRVADFGLAKLSVNLQTVTTTATRTGMVRGTPGYASPEQRRGENGLDHRADVFSLGVSLYEMLTGHMPMGVFEPPSKKTGSPPSLDKVIIRALRERPADRYQKASDMRTALLNVKDSQERSLVQRSIARRPIVSMMTSIIVGAGFIYLLDALNTELLEKPASLSTTYVDSEHGPTVVRLDDRFSLVRLRLNWEEARRRVDATPGMEMASFHSQAELDQALQALQKAGVAAPVWTGGFKDAKTGRPRWDDGTPFNFEAWMPAASAPPLIITELQAKNRQTLRLPGGYTPDWIEVHNSGEKPVEVTGWHLRHFTGRYAFEGRLGARSRALQNPWIQPGEYRVIPCAEVDQEMLGTTAYGFQLEAQTGRIVWSDPQGNLIQDMPSGWTEFPADASLVYLPQTQTWAWGQKPTPGKENGPVKSGLEDDEAARQKPANRTGQAILMLPEFEGRWSWDTQRRTAWSLVMRPRGK